MDMSAGSCSRFSRDPGRLPFGGSVTGEEDPRNASEECIGGLRAQGVVIVAVYKGDSCVICNGYLRLWLSIPDLRSKLREWNGRLILLSPLQQSHAESSARTQGWNVEDQNIISVVGDDNFRFVVALNRLLPTAAVRFGRWPDRSSLLEDGPRMIPQTTVLRDGEVVFSMKGSDKPSLANSWSSINRPDPLKVWKQIREMMDGCCTRPVGNIRPETMIFFRAASRKELLRSGAVHKYALLGGKTPEPLGTIEEECHDEEHCELKDHS